MLINTNLNECEFGVGYINVFFEDNSPIEYNLEQGEFIELAIRIEKLKILYIDFGIDYHFIKIELGEDGRRNRIKILFRNFNGELYVFDENIINLHQFTTFISDNLFVGPGILRIS